MFEEEFTVQVLEENGLTLTNKLLPRFLKRLATAQQLMVSGITACRPLTIPTAEGLMTTMVFVRDIGGIIIIPF